jgi:hypothetical protein
VAKRKAKAKKKVAKRKAKPKTKAKKKIAKRKAKPKTKAKKSKAKNKVARGGSAADLLKSWMLRSVS